MNLPIEVSYPAGATLYFIVHNPDSTVWNGTTWESFTPANWATYAIHMTEQAGSGYYRGVYPVGISDVITTEAIYVQAGGSPALGDAPSIGLGQSQGMNIRTISGVQVAADNMAVSGSQLIRGTAQAGTLTNTSMPTNLTSVLANAYRGRTIIWTSGDLVGVATAIVSYTVAGGVLTYSPVPVAPAAADTFIIV